MTLITRCLCTTLFCRARSWVLARQWFRNRSWYPVIYLCGWASITNSGHAQWKFEFEQHEVVWWLVAFTSAFETLHGLSSRASQWLSKLLSVLLMFLGRYSDTIAGISAAFSSSTYLRSKYLSNQVATCTLQTKAVCNKCHALYDYGDCIEKRGTQYSLKFCHGCSQRNPLLHKMITPAGNTKFYPFLVYPFCPLILSI